VVAATPVSQSPGSVPLSYLIAENNVRRGADWQHSVKFSQPIVTNGSLQSVWNEPRPVPEVGGWSKALVEMAGAGRNTVGASVRQT